MERTAENVYLMVTRIPRSMFLLHKSSVGQIILGLLRIPVSLPRSQKLSLDPTMDKVCINFTRYHTIGGLGQRSLYSDSLRSVVRIPVGGRFSASLHGRPWGLASHLYRRISFPGVKRLGRGVDDPPPSSAEVQERVQIYIYSPFRLFMSCSRLNFTFYTTCRLILTMSSRLRSPHVHCTARR